jgi:hypothetical protein
MSTTTTERPTKRRHLNQLWAYGALGLADNPEHVSSRLRSLAPRPFIRLLRGQPEPFTWPEVALAYWEWLDLLDGLRYWIHDRLNPVAWALVNFADWFMPGGHERLSAASIRQAGFLQGEESALRWHEPRTYLAENDIVNRECWFTLDDAQRDRLTQVGIAVDAAISTARDAMLVGDLDTASAAITSLGHAMVTEHGEDWPAELVAMAKAHVAAKAQLEGGQR